MSAQPSDRSSSGPSIASLLEPTLEVAPPAPPLLSVRACFFVAFFGGVYAAALFCAANSRRMQRLSREVWIGVLASLAWSALLFRTGLALGTGRVPDWLSFAGTPQATVRLAGRVLALALFGAYYLRWRTTYKVQALAGVASPNPWPTALVALGVSFVLSAGFGVLGWIIGRG